MLANTLRDADTERFTTDATNKFDVLNSGLRADRLDAYAIAESYTIAVGQDRAQRADYQPQLKLLYDNIHRRDADLELAGIILRVDATARAVFEATQGAELGQPYEITTMDVAGRMTSAPARPTYYPLVFVEPTQPGNEHFGVDLGTGSNAITALVWADRRDVTNVSRPVEMRIAGKTINGYLVVAPLKTGMDGGQAHLIGYAMEFDSLDKLLAETSGDSETIGTVALFDSGAAKPDVAIASRGRALQPNTTLPQLKRSDAYVSKEINLGDHVWTIVFMPAPGDLYNWLIVGLVIVANAVFIFLIGIYLFSATNKTLVLESVESALRDSHSELSSSAAVANRRAWQLTLLSEMSNMLQACDTLDEVLLVTGMFVPKMFEVESGAIYLLDTDRTTADSRMSWGPNLPPTKVFAFQECVAFRKGGVYQVADVENDLLCQHLGDPKPASYVCAPMLAQGRAIGLFYLAKGMAEKRKAPADDQISRAAYELATTVAEHLAMALANIDLRDRLKAQSITDPLTKLYNRRYMEDMLEREIKRADRAGTSVGLIMFDIDLFKNVNDTFGHEAGDLVLETLGVFLKTNVRAEDIACRYGGEEFLLIQPNSDREQTNIRADDIRRKAQLLNIEASGTSLGQVTLSGGVAVYPDDGGTRNAVVAYADEAMYRAKDAGRNRIE